MIYFKICRCFREDVESSIFAGNREDLGVIQSLPTIVLIKIGYTKDERDYTRTSCYRTENPNIISYKSYLEGTETDEAVLHKRFRDKRFKGREWFVLDEEILDFLQRHKTIQDIRKELVDFYNTTSFYEEIHPLAVSILKITSPELLGTLEYRKEEERLEKELCSAIIHEDSSRSWVERTYPEECNKIYEELEKYTDWLRNGRTQVENELNEFEKIPYFHDRMKYVCIQGELLDPLLFDLFLNSIPKEFKNYYTILGSGGCSACKFQRGELEKEYQKRIGNQDIDIRFYIEKEFNIGNRYLYSEIKEKLTSLYFSLGYNVTPKATDLEKYFVLKHCQITNKETGKRDHGYRIISKK